MNKADKVALEYSGGFHFTSDKKEAEASGLKFDVPFADYLKIILKKCFFCKSPGKTPITTKQKRSRLDRKDRLKHFTLENTIPVCGYCYKARRVISPSMVWHVVLVNKKLGLITATNRLREKR